MSAVALLASEGSTRADFVDLSVPGWAWAAVGAVVLALLLFDIMVLHRHAGVPSFKRAIGETIGWLSIGVAFGLVVLGVWGRPAAGEYFAGYLIELSLSVDNVFVWALLLSYFLVPREYQHRVLFWGIFGAVALRAVFIFGGVALVNRFEWILIAFGVLLLYSAVQLLRHDEEDEVDPTGNIAFKLVRRIVPSVDEYDGQKLFTHVDGKRYATPLFVVLVMIETTDVLFAVDSVPAVLALAREQFIVLTSNAFAILGLRALYFLFEGLRERFTFLQQGLAVILSFVGVKMIISEWVHIPTAVSLVVIAVVLAVAIAASLLKPRVPAGG